MSFRLVRPLPSSWAFPIYRIRRLDALPRTAHCQRDIERIRYPLSIYMARVAATARPTAQFNMSVLALDVVPVADGGLGSFGGMIGSMFRVVAVAVMFILATGEPLDVSFVWMAEAKLVLARAPVDAAVSNCAFKVAALAVGTVVSIRVITEVPACDASRRCASLRVEVGARFPVPSQLLIDFVPRLDAFSAAFLTSLHTSVLTVALSALLSDASIPVKTAVFLVCTTKFATADPPAQDNFR